MATNERPGGQLRADAERNRQRLLAAAETAFAERGLDVSVAQIARAAGVGQGTAFRRFPTKEHLIAAIVVERLRDLVSEVEHLTDAEDMDAAICEFLRRGTSRYAGNRGLFEAVSAGTVNTPEVRAARNALLDVADRIVRRAQAHGVIRDDVTGVDLVLLQSAACRAAQQVGASAPQMWQRYLALVRDALRPEGARPLGHRAPTRAEMTDLAHTPRA